MKWLLDRLVDWWMSRCPHADDNVAADIMEGSVEMTYTRWCRRCGAYKFEEGEWRRPRPMWAEPYNSRAMLRDAKADAKRGRS